MWNLSPPPAFQGLHPDKPVSVYVRHLPHWRQVGATYFVTFRLSDALPQNKLREIHGLRREWERQHPPPYADAALQELAREILTRMERWLDQGLGSCLLQNHEAVQEVIAALRHFDGERYELGCAEVMPNHVHATVRPLFSDGDPLERILQSWKRHTARKINRRFGLKDALWQEESFDRIIRDEEHLWRVIQYIGQNPAKAGQTVDACGRWIRPEWEQVGWRFQDP